MEKVDANTSTSAKKLKSGASFDFEVNASFGYRLINFISVFSAISEVVKCKKCGDDINFTETSLRGLGFKLKINCGKCEPVLINSCPLIDDRAYDEMRAQEKTKEARKLRRAAQKESEDMAASLENLLYGPGIAD